MGIIHLIYVCRTFLRQVHPFVYFRIIFLENVVLSTIHTIIFYNITFCKWELFTNGWFPPRRARCFKKREYFAVQSLQGPRSPEGFGCRSTHCASSCWFP